MHWMVLKERELKRITVLAVLCSASLSACVTYSPSVPATYTGPVAQISDSVMPYEATKMDMFYLSEVDGKKVTNSLVGTIRANQGNGLNPIKLSLTKRPVPAIAAEFKIVGRTYYAAPIQAMTNPVYEVEGLVRFIPEAGKTYVVKGDLGKNYSGVWIEDEQTHQVLDHKIELRRSAVAAPEPVKNIAIPAWKSQFVAKQTLPFSIAVDTPVDVRPNYATVDVAGTNWHGCKYDTIWGTGAALAIGKRLSSELAGAKLFQQVLEGSQSQAEFHLKSEVRAFCGDTRRTSFITYRGAGIVSLHFSLERGGKEIWQGTLEKVVTDDSAEYSGSQFTTKDGAMTQLMADVLRVALADLVLQLQQVTLR